MRARGFYEIEIDDQAVINQFGADKVAEIAVQFPNSIAMAVSMTLGNIPGVKDAKVSPIPMMLLRDQL